MQKNKWINFLVDSKAIESIYSQDKDIPDLKKITIENILLGFNLNNIKIKFQYPMPNIPPKKFILKNYNIIIGDLNFLDIHNLKIEKSKFYIEEEVYDFFFKKLSEDNIDIEIKGSLGSRLQCSAGFISLLNFKGEYI